MDAAILFEDAHLVLAYKPYGLLSEEHDSLPNLPALLREQTGGAVYPVHRLDKTTQGLIVYARTSAAAAGLSATILRHEMEKTYLAVVEGCPDESGRLSDLLFYDRARGKSFVVKRERKGVKRAELFYTRLAQRDIGDLPAALLRIRLTTGRTHQIRVQFASRKMPLAGDRRYGSHIPAENIALCASELRFPHPVTGESLCFTYSPQDEIFR